MDLLNFGLGATANISRKLCLCGCSKFLKINAKQNFICGHKKNAKTLSKLCECNCGFYTKPGNRFINGHQRRNKQSTLGYTHSKEVKKQISVKMKGRQNSLGHKHSEEQNKKQSIAMQGQQRGLGYTHTEKWKKEQSIRKLGNHNTLGRKQPDEEKEKRRQIAYTMWADLNSNFRWPKKESYWEKIFREFLENGGLVKNIDFIQERHFGTYFLDFAFPDLKLDIEIDGEQHLEPEAVEHDLKRDNFVYSQNWQTIRIPTKKLKFLIKTYDGLY